MTHTAYISLGANLGDRRRNLSEAARLIRERLGKLYLSRFYQTAAWGNEDQPPFLNQVGQLLTRATQHTLLNKLQQIEQDLGRTRTRKWGERTIDLDILFYDDLTLDTPDLIIPHPHIPERRFVLAPLAEIAPNLKHPLLNKTVRQLLHRCPDTLACLPLTNSRGLTTDY